MCIGRVESINLGGWKDYCCEFQDKQLIKESWHRNRDIDPESKGAEREHRQAADKAFPFDQHLLWVINFCVAGTDEGHSLEEIPAR
jgi:hypothetical protein